MRIWALLVLLLTVAGCADPARTVSLGAYRNAVSHRVGAELAQRGIALRQPLWCRTHGARRVEPGGAFSVRCSGTGARGSAVSVTGKVTAVGTPGQLERYVVSRDGSELFRIALPVAAGTSR